MQIIMEVLQVFCLDGNKSGKIPVIAPKGFVEAAVNENVMVGSQMKRRSMLYVWQLT